MENTSADYKRLVSQTEGDLHQELLPKQTEISPHTFDQTKSIIFALLTGLFFALHNLTLGSLTRLGYLARSNTGLGIGIGAVIYYSYQFVDKRRKNQAFFDWEKSVFRNQNPQVSIKHRGKFEYWILAGVIAMALISIGSGLIVIVSFKLALEGGMNQGVITAIYGTTPFIISIMFYIKFGETLKISQLIGMVFMIFCITMIGFLRAPSAEAITQADYNPNGVAIALILSMICPFFFALDGLIIRLLCMKFRVNPNELSQAAHLCQGGIVIIGTLLGYLVDNYKYEFIWLDFLQMVLAGIIVNFGGACLSISVSLGNVGVGYSLINSQVIIFILLAALLLGQIPTTIEIVAVAFGIVGSCIMSLGPEIYNKLIRIINTRLQE
ncbi:unnamed protein product [Moneuplotes crassus]|uniref:EamA domain-containing protein n=1 Tax=Euplotes crassus TaxID=5936 RepID=A0AAD1URP2_EUPCR|nr:unnamed protein product [Moneuplotes crassus]